MDIFEMTALEKPVTAIVEIPASKSYTNRALLMAALTKGAVTLYNPLYSEDTEAMIACLQTLGLRLDTQDNRTIVHDDFSSIQDKHYALFANNSGTTMRFLLPLLCLAPGIKELKGSARLNERPIKGLVEALRLLGARIDNLGEKDHPPLKIHPSLLSSKGEVALDASISSQFISALLMTAPLLGGIKIHLHGSLVSQSYTEMTIHMMREWGIDVLRISDRGYHIPPGQQYRKNRYDIEGDFSSAGYFLAVAALTQSNITIKNLNPDSVQGDRQFLHILEKMGNTVTIDRHGITIIGKRILPLTLNMQDCPDQVQTMAVLAAFAQGTTKISGVRSLRSKETERVQALKNELGKMGIHTEDTFDTLTIYGGRPHAATIETYGDHRMAMAFAVAGTKLPHMKICQPEVVNKTFPTFWEKLRSL